MADTVELMRRHVLNMAIRGELVEQREEEGTAEKLFQNIQSEKKLLIKAGAIKKEKALSDIKDSDFPFKIPNNWQWIHFGEIINLISGRDLETKDFNELEKGLPYITGASNFNNGNLIVSRWTEKPKVISLKGDLLITVKGTIGEMHFQTIEKAHIARQIMAIRNIFNVNADYLKYFLDAQLLELKEKAKSMIPGVSREDILLFELPLPPLAEQKRIVVKIEEILAVIDQIGTRKEVSLAIIEKIRQKSLQNAIMGQLVEQNENDEPASELFKKIHFEKEQMIISKNVKKPKPLKFSAENENEYDIPLNWEWTKLDDIAVINRGASPRPIKAFVTEDEDGVNWIKIGDSVRGKKYIDSVNQKITKDGAEKSVYVSKGDLIMSNSMSFGYAYIMNTDGCIHDGWLSFKLPKELVDINWMHYMLNANYDNFEKLAVGTGVRNLNIDRVRSVYVGLPPLAEQYRIVEKLDQIMAICDQMQNILDGSSKINEALKVTE